MIVGRIGPAALGLLLTPPSSSFVDADVFTMRPPKPVGGPPPPQSSLEEAESSFLASVDAVHGTCDADVSTLCPTPEERFLADLVGGNVAAAPTLSMLFGPPPRPGGGGGGVDDLDEFLRSVMPPHPPPPPPAMPFGPREDPLGDLLDEFVATALLAAGAPPLPPSPEAREEKEETESANQLLDLLEEKKEELGDFVEDWNARTAGREDEAEGDEKAALRAEAALDAMVGRLAERYSDASGSASRSEASESRDDEAATEENAPLTDGELAQRIARHGVALIRREEEEPKSDAGGDKAEAEEEDEEEEDPELRRRLARRLSEVDEAFFAVLPPRGFLVVSEVERPSRLFDIGKGEEELPLPKLRFGCRRDRCLWRARQEGAASPPCARAMDRAKATFHDLLRAQEGRRHENNGRRDAVARRAEPRPPSAARAQKDLRVAAEVSALSAFLLSFALSLSVYVLLRLAFSARRGGGGGRFRLRRKILSAVYDDPALKSAVEERVGESLGEGPPPPRPRGPWPHGRRGEGCGPPFHRFCRSLPLVGLSVLLVLTSLTNPDAVLLVGGTTLICMSLYGAIVSCFCSSPSSDDKSVEERARCCCCGMAPSGGASGDKKMSCSCCNGTGVCGPDCGRCCSRPASAGGYPGALALERRRQRVPAASAEPRVYEGVPVQVV